MIRGFDSAAMDRLLAWSWPGNVRELVNAIEHAVVMCTNNVITAEDLPRSVTGTCDGLGDCDAFGGGSRTGSLRELVNEFESQVIRNALMRHGGNRSHTAVELGISRRTLLYKLQEYGLATPAGEHDA